MHCEKQALFNRCTCLRPKHSVRICFDFDAIFEQRIWFMTGQSKCAVKLYAIIEKWLLVLLLRNL